MPTHLSKIRKKHYAKQVIARRAANAGLVVCTPNGVFNSNQANSFVGKLMASWEYWRRYGNAATMVLFPTMHQDTPIWSAARSMNRKKKRPLKTPTVGMCTGTSKTLYLIPSLFLMISYRWRYRDLRLSLLFKGCQELPKNVPIGSSGITIL